MIMLADLHKQEPCLESPISYVINMNYNADGLPYALTYPVSTSSYRLKTKFEYGYGVLKKISDFNAPSTVFWQLNAQDERGQPIDEQLGNGAHIISGFDPLTGLIDYRQVGTASPWTNRQNLSFEWDDNGNLKKRIDVNQSNLTEEFFYDALNRLDYSQLNGVTNLDLTLDAIGNITAKTSTTNPAEDAGTYSYHATKKHAVISTSKGWSFGYDANGNMNSYKGNTIAWTSYNLPSTINAAGQSSTFAYGPNRNRWRQVASYPSGTETTIYVGGILEKVTVPSGTAYRHYISAGSASVVYTRWSTGTINTKYVTSDHLGSSTAVMDGSGASLVNLSFGSFGARRGSAWTGTPSAGDWTQIANATRQGFTGHEGLDNVNFIHMNGRVYEPVLGRFISADPFTPASLGSQAPNRYAYIGNQTLSATDPSGYFPRNGNALKQWRNGPGTLDALELAINYSWNRWGGVRNVSDGLEGTHAGLLAHSMDVLARGGAVNGTTITAANVVWGSGSFGQSHINGIFALASARSSSRTSVAGGPSGAISGADGVTQLGEVVVTASRRGSSEQISWTPGRMSPSGPALVGSGHLSYGHRERDRFGPNSGTWVKILVGGADSMGALGVEGNAGIYFGRDLDGNFEAGLYDDSGFGLGLAASVDFAGFEVLTGLDSLDNSQSINIFGSAGPFSGHISLDRPNANVYSGQLNGYGANLSLGPIPVEAGVTFTTTRTWALFGGRR